MLGNRVVAEVQFVIGGPLSVEGRAGHHPQATHIGSTEQVKETGTMKTPIQKLAKKVEQEQDSFAEGDVIRWVAQPELSRAYTYVAVKAGGRWWISGTSAWYVHSGVSYEDLATYLARPEVHSIQAVTEWSDKVKEEAPQLRLARATAEAAPRCDFCRAPESVCRC